MRQTWVYDKQSCQFLTRDEYNILVSKRNDKKSKRYELPNRVERGSWVYDRKSGKILDRNDYGAVSIRHVKDISDVMPLTKHPVTGKYHDSKSKFRAETRAVGGYEVGNDMPTRSRPTVTKEERRETIKKAMYGLTGSYDSVKIDTSNAREQLAHMGRE